MPRSPFPPFKSFVHAAGPPRATFTKDIRSLGNREGKKEISVSDFLSPLPSVLRVTRNCLWAELDLLHKIALKRRDEEKTRG